MENDGKLRFASLLTVLIICALFLSARLIYLFLADVQRFPVTTVKVTANFQHIARKQLEGILANYLNASFFSLSMTKLESELKALDWTQEVNVERVWPDTIKITLVEKEPVAVWNELLMTRKGQLFRVDEDLSSLNLPKLIGPVNQQKDVLQIYQKLSKLLATYGLFASSLQLRDNQAWEISLTNGVKLQLGKRDLEKRLLRFCKAYLAVFADKTEQLSSVDLRYARGMAVRWKQQTGR